MNKNRHKMERRQRRHGVLRRRISGTSDRPRLSVYKSLNHFYAQLIDDLAGHTLASVSTAEVKGDVGGKTSNARAAAAVGARLAEKAKARGVAAVVFDRGGFKYHGRLKAFADAARKGGLKF